MDLIFYPDQRLFQKTEPVTEFNEELKNTLNNMLTVMDNHNGLGLSANQVGIMKRMFVMKDNNGKPLFIINPVIKETEGNAIINEGCLSLPGAFVQVLSRANNIAVEFQDETGEVMEGIFRGLEAVCFQHELDHLSGEFFIDKTTRQQKRNAIKEYERKKVK